MQPRQSAPRPRRAVTRAVPLTLALSAFAIIAAACGASPGASVANLGSSTSTTTPPTATGDSGAAKPPGVKTLAPNGGSSQGTIGIGGVTVQFSECMRTHGIANFPDPNGQGQVTFSGVDPQSGAFSAAQRACAKYAPNGGKAPTAAQQQQAQAQALRYSQCMRSHGIADFPDPQFSGGRIRISLRAGQNSDLDPHNPRFQAAQTACQSLTRFGKFSTAAG